MGWMRWTRRLAVVAVVAVVLAAVATDARDEPLVLDAPDVFADDVLHESLQYHATPLSIEHVPTDAASPRFELVPGGTFSERFPQQPRTEADLREQLALLGLPPARIAEVVAVAEPALVLARRDGLNGSVDGGASQIGGLPLLPVGELWPTADGRPLSLVAQIDLDAVGDRLDGRLPAGGVLQFWLKLDWSHPPPLPPDPTVVWWPDRSVLEQRTSGHAGWGDTAIPVDSEPVLSVPLHGDRVFRHWPRHELDLYRQMPEPLVIDQLGGWPFEFQFDPTGPIAMRAAGVDSEQVRPPEPFPSNGSDEDRREWLLRRDAAVAQLADVEQWRLVLQLEMTPGDHMWADGGNVWFMGLEDELASGTFTEILGELASH